MIDPAADSAANRWLHKKVLASRLLDDMTTPAHWTAFTTGAPEVADARVKPRIGDRDRAVATIAFARNRSRGGRKALRMRLPSRLEGPGPANGRGWGGAGVRRRFDGEDWRRFNRLSLWIRPDCRGHGVVALGLCLHNDGAEKLPAAFGQEGETTVDLKDREWNHVVWEIGNVARDRVTRLEISGLMSGHEPGAATTLTFDLDRLELEQVEPDYIEGWEVWPGRIACSHAGYRPGAAKCALASGVGARTFKLIDRATGKTVLSKATRPVRAALGRFEVMDFSEVRRPGTYILVAGRARTHEFRIGPDAWRPSIEKALRFFRAERCGTSVPGVHGVCHKDWTVVHGGKRIVINGGWHDAGDLTQGLGNTAEIVYALFSMAERLTARRKHPGLGRRLVREARWGIDWILKTSFHDGFRNQGSVNSRWTDGIIGTNDDVTVEARNTPMNNFTAAAAEAIAARVLARSDPRLAARCRRMAAEDWEFARAGMAARPAAGPFQRWRVTFDSDHVELEVASIAALASVDLWQVTREAKYAALATRCARTILACQERTRPDWKIPLDGFFYTSPARDRLLHYCHRGRDQGPIQALVRLCEALPGHPDRTEWRSAVARYTRYLKTAARLNCPWGVLPASIYREDEASTVPPGLRESFRAQVRNGIPLGKGHYLRRFPVWTNYRGHFGVLLPQAQALAAAGRLLDDPEAAALAERQAEWIVGFNPFAQSAMYGLGSDFPPLYAPLFGNHEGSLPVGFQTRGDRDVPYWPVQATWTYKEVWVHPVACWIRLMADLM
ncbi:MAG: glycoside hydrolase family 9 protein [Candidatus Coatesbacteria bacterium]